MTHECQSSDISGYDLILFEERKLDYSWWRDVGGVELWYGGD